MKVWHLLAAVGGLVILLTPRKAQGYAGGKAFELELSPIGGGYYLSVPAANAFLTMKAAAAKAGVTLVVNSAFRTFEEQKALDEGPRGSFAAAAGYSPHQSGKAVDVESASGTNAAFDWLTAHAAEFKFRRVRADEPWHWEHNP